MSIIGFPVEQAKKIVSLLNILSISTRFVSVSDWRNYPLPSLRDRKSRGRWIYEADFDPDSNHNSDNRSRSESPRYSEMGEGGQIRSTSWESVLPVFA